jgi:N-acetylmuramoyl-L-alanine amidase
MLPWGCRPSDKKKIPGEKRPRATIVLDPGHGGKDAGACPNLRLLEKDVVLDIALRVERLLKQEGLRVVMTRRTDEYISLSKRAEVANVNHATLFVSIHANSTGIENASGFEIYYTDNGRESESLKAARFLQQCFLKATRAKDRGIRKYRYVVLSQARCPAVLVEVGYLSNGREAELLSRRSYRRSVAEGIARGILAYTRVGS